MDDNQTDRIRIKDIADELGLSTATVSNVIHGKRGKISQRTMEKVQKLLEERQYVPNMAAVLLAQNSSKIICVVLSKHEKYEGHMLQDSFINEMVDCLSANIDAYGYFMMLKEEPDIQAIAKYASMWNMAGLILIGYCQQEYEVLRNQMRIPFVVMDGYCTKVERYANVDIDNYSGGFQMGEFMAAMGHKRVMFLADNDEAGDHERYEGFRAGLKMEAAFYPIPELRKERGSCYEKIFQDSVNYTAAFCASDTYAIELMNNFMDRGLKIPDDFSIAGFDDIKEAELVRPRLTTIRQDVSGKAVRAMEMLEALIEGKQTESYEKLPVRLMIRDSVKKIEAE